MGAQRGHRDLDGRPRDHWPGGSHDGIEKGWVVRGLPSLGGCSADFNHDGFVNGDDYDAFAEAFDAGNQEADLNRDGFVNGNDYDAFADRFDAGC
jgi:hypothetical protein